MTAPVTITADPDLPAVHITRDFAATPAQVLRAHTDPELFVRWCGPNDIGTTIDYWDARTGGSWRFLNHRDGANGHEEYGFHGSFHEVTDTGIVQTFTFEGMPDSVSLERLTVTDLGDGRTRLSGTSVFTSFADRDGMLASGMEHGVTEGYAKLDALLAGGAV